MKFKLLTAIAFFIFNSSFAKEYSCPKIPAGEYVSFIDTHNDWYIYAMQIDTNQTIMEFKVNSNVVWDELSIEPLLNADGSKSNLISCASNAGNHLVSIMVTVPESFCSLKNNAVFNCN